MKIEEARQNIGRMVMSRDAGHKLIPLVGKEHGPYRLLRVTKSGLAVLEGRQDVRVKPSLLTLHEPPT